MHYGSEAFLVVTTPVDDPQEQAALDASVQQLEEAIVETMADAIGFTVIEVRPLGEPASDRALDVVVAVEHATRALCKRVARDKLATTLDGDLDALLEHPVIESAERTSFTLDATMTDPLAAVV
jgi:hypothetical protein